MECQAFRRRHETVNSRQNPVRAREGVAELSGSKCLDGACLCICPVGRTQGPCFLRGGIVDQPQVSGAEPSLRAASHARSGYWDTAGSETPVSVRMPSHLGDSHGAAQDPEAMETSENPAREEPCPPPAADAAVGQGQVRPVGSAALAEASQVPARGRKPTGVCRRPAACL